MMEEMYHGSVARLLHLWLWGLYVKEQAKP
jgi:hypothetical protein